MNDERRTRVRRGKVVEIPEQFRLLGPNRKTIRQRPSKLTGKVKRIVKDSLRMNRYKDAKDIPLE